MAPSFCCRVLGNADGERCLGAGDHQEVTVVGSYFVLLRLRRSPFESSASESMRCRNRSAPSDAPQSLWDFALRVMSPGIWWSRGESNPRPTHIIVNIWGDFAPPRPSHCRPIKAHGEFLPSSLALFDPPGTPSGSTRLEGPAPRGSFKAGYVSGAGLHGS